MEQQNLTSAVESILFVADRPVTLARLKEVFGEQSPPDEALTQIIEGLRDRYQQSECGFELREAQGGFQFCTKIDNAEWVRKFLATKPFRLGRSALEVLSIIAYRQPLTRAEIDQVRGIDSSHLLRVLIERGLVKMAGKAELPGRPVQYATTPRFLEVVGLETLAQLPPLTELEQLQGDTEDPIKTLESGLDRIMSESKTVESTLAEDSEGLLAIDNLLQTAEGGEKEVYESKAHAEVAEENRAAVAGFQLFMKPKRRSRKTVSYQELTTGPILDLDSQAAADEAIPDLEPRLPELPIEIPLDPETVN